MAGNNYAFPEKDIRDIMMHAFGAVPSYERMRGGDNNVLYKLSFDERPPLYPDMKFHKDMIFRMSPPYVGRHAMAMYGFEFDQMNSEKYVYSKCAEAGIPTMDMVYVDTGREFYPCDHMFAEYFPKGALSDYCGTKEEMKRLYFELGKLLKKFHSISSEKCGMIALKLRGIEYNTWSECFKDDVARWSRVAEEFGAFTKDEIKAAERYFDERTSLLDEVKNFCLVHNDLWAGNILLKDGENGAEIGAFIDAGGAMFGDTEKDFLFPWMDNEDFLEGYGERKSCPERQDLYRLYAHLNDAFYWFHVNPNKANYLYEKETAFQMMK
ncbi:MAG: aminoglycoside phosphotransferase family protein [Ruminococcaceae bacterium]|nr:aminoglycoside phosphotransferase family protein [Oscillospiraceae bacterium]